MKTFTIVGTSTLGRMTKTRVANGSIKARSAVLARNGHTLINFIELPEAMSKLDAINFFDKWGWIFTLCRALSFRKR